MGYAIGFLYGLVQGIAYSLWQEKQKRIRGLSHYTDARSAFVWLVLWIPIFNIIMLLYLAFGEE